MSRIALVTGATQGLGLALVAGLAQRMEPDDTVYLTGRDPDRVERAVASVPPGRARVRGELLDVADPDGAPETARRPADRAPRRRRRRHRQRRDAGRSRRRPARDRRASTPRSTTSARRGCCALSRRSCPTAGGSSWSRARSGRCTTSRPSLHDRFDRPATLDEVDAAVAAWRDAVADGSARAGDWPGFVNIPSKIGQVAAVRALAAAAAGGGPPARDPARRGVPRDDQHADVGPVVGRRRRADPGRGGRRACSTSRSAPSTRRTTASSSATAASCPGGP